MLLALSLTTASLTVAVCCLLYLLLKPSKPGVETQLSNKLLQKDLERLEKLVTESFSQEGRERHSLKDVISELQQAHKHSTKETQILSQALKGQIQAQGSWGEAVLENILESSGLRQGQEFSLQGKGMQLKTETGSSSRPDVVIKLPEGRHLLSIPKSPC